MGVGNSFFHDHLTSSSLFSGLSGLELTLHLPQLPLSNGCMSQGKYPTKREL